MSKKFKKNKSMSWIIASLIGAVFIVIVMWIAWIQIPKNYDPPSNSGEFGDMFGFVNALFSGLALLGVIVAILMQREELELQRDELADTREELKAQRQL